MKFVPILKPHLKPNMTMTASEMGKRSAAARKKKYKIRDWSKHMRKVANARYQKLDK